MLSFVIWIKYMAPSLSWGLNGLYEYIALKVKNLELSACSTQSPQFPASKKMFWMFEPLLYRFVRQGWQRGRTTMLAWVYLLKWDLLDCLVGCSLGSPTLAVSRGKRNLVTVQSTRVHVSTVPDWRWSPGRLLEGCWISVYAGILKNLHLMPVSTAGLMNLPRRGRASRASFIHGFLCGLPTKRSRLRRDSLPDLDTPIKKNMGFSWFQMRSNRQPS